MKIEVRVGDALVSEEISTGVVGGPPEAINPQNLALILQFIATMLPIILQLINPPKPTA